MEIRWKKVSRHTVDNLTKEITSKKVRRNNMDFLTIEITQKKVRGNNADFSTIEITLKKVRGNNVHFWPSKLHRKKYVETTRIFWSAKLHQKSMLKWRGNSSKFGVRCIDVISTSNRRWFNMKCPLGWNKTSSATPIVRFLWDFLGILAFLKSDGLDFDSLQTAGTGCSYQGNLHFYHVLWNFPQNHWYIWLNER